GDGRRRAVPPTLPPLPPLRLRVLRAALSTAVPPSSPALAAPAPPPRHELLLERLRLRHLMDHFLTENHISTVNYHGEVPAEERVENLNKFRNEEGDCPTLVCTDLAARGLDLEVDHVIMFDFPKNSIDYLHRTGRTARMGAKGKVTSLIAKKDVGLATRIEDAMKKNESLESLTTSNVKRDSANSQNTGTKGRTSARSARSSDAPR
uniref:Helicase C-terminal domain-containing protein n=1 Tax=Aegilops tauschii subsp. strangulata TaxID=200361 RepID=A0A453E803_AEGTS